MGEFTYELPDNKSFLKTILTIMSRDQFYKRFLDYFVGSYCEINPTDSFSRNRWNAMYTGVNFYLPTQSYASIDDARLEMLKSYLLKVSQSSMPPSAGYDIMEINIIPAIQDTNEIDDLESLMSEINKDDNNFDIVNLSEDIKQKGKEMAETYTVLYILENYLRKIIDKILSEKIGENYMSIISIPSDVKKGIERRKKDEKKNAWLPIRGDNELYYLDFNELALIIINNWDIFKEYFPSQAWIQVRIEDLYKIRCLIAHNSYINKDEREAVSVNSKQILRQLNQFEIF